MKKPYNDGTEYLPFSPEELLEKLVIHFIKKWLLKSPEPASEPTSVVVRGEAPKQSRHIPQALRDHIWRRDHAKCQYRDPKTGKFCGSNQKLELDHIYAYALGGGTPADNLQLKCRAHNLWRSEMLFGKVLEENRTF